MKNKIVMITGPTSGIGLVSAEVLAQMGATLILVARNEQKVSKLIERLKTSTNNHNIEYIIGDLSLMSEVRKVAAEFKNRKYYRLDVLMNNVGIMMDHLELTREGHEKTMATNHYSWFLLTHLLLTQLKSSPAARIVNVASNAHKYATLDFDNLNQEKKFSAINSYGSSKTAMIACTYELARRLKRTNVTVNALHPGAVNTGFSSDLKKPLLMKIVGFFIKRITPEEGAKTQIFLATDPELEGVTGKYWDEKGQPIQSNAQSREEGFAKRIYEITQEKVGMEVMA